MNNARTFEAEFQINLNKVDTNLRNQLLNYKQKAEMKGLFLSLIIFSVCATSVKSQLQVGSSGNVGVGITNDVIAYEGDSIVHSPFAVCTVGIDDAIANFQSIDRQYALTAYTDRTAQQGDGTSMLGICDVYNGNSEGVVGIGIAYSGNSNFTIGVRGEVYGGYNSIGVYGGKYGSVNNNYAGIFGTINSGSPYFQFPGSYAGYFVGTVRATGPMYAQAYYTPSANPTGGNGINSSSANLIRKEERVTEKLRNVSSFELQHNEEKATKEETTPADKFLNGRDIQQLSKKELLQFDSIRRKMIPEKIDPLSYVNYGLDAGQLKAMFPKLVQQDKEGNYSINYIEMIPLLVKSINELSEELEELKGASAKRAKAQSGTTSIEETIPDVDIVRMDQNKPNPFSESTVIGLNIQEKTQKANVLIYDLSGKQIQSVPVTERGETNITLYAGDLGAGMYIYTLVVDGKVVVTRRMIVEF